ncbi:hypothetical protein [Pseudomonas sp. RL]|uniref:gp33 family protein n=1 Tax=Pseudomonas sp. RL TaxID=1452718 RepID=UPI000482FD16|nr:hypothetical protein [Pseudomonas sp. RL]
MTVATPTKTRLDTLAEERDRLREAKRELERQVASLDEQLKANEQDIIELADQTGLTRFAVGKLSFSISENTVGQVEDWDTVYDYIHDNRAFHLLQRRLSNAAYKELLDAGEAPRGINPVTLRSLNMRKAT